MKVTLKDKIESAHQWIDDEGKRHHAVIVGDKGDVLDSETLTGVLNARGEKVQVGDAERALKKLIKLGLASE